MRRHLPDARSICTWIYHFTLSDILKEKSICMEEKQDRFHTNIHICRWLVMQGFWFEKLYEKPLEENGAKSHTHNNKGIPNLFFFPDSTAIQPASQFPNFYSCERFYSQGDFWNTYLYVYTQIILKNIWKTAFLSWLSFGIKLNNSKPSDVLIYFIGRNMG